LYHSDDDVNNNNKKKKKTGGVSFLRNYIFRCWREKVKKIEMKKKHKIYEQKTKEQAKEQPPETKVSRKHRNAVIRFAINQSRVTSPYTLCVVFYRSLCARAYGLEVNQNECRQAGKLAVWKYGKTTRWDCEIGRAFALREETMRT